MSSMNHRLVVSVAVCTVAAGGLCLPPASPVGDANGDTAVDVLDLQVVIAQVLGGASEKSPKADVNGDGRVDVRDFQCMLDLTRQADTGDPLPGDQEKDRQAVVVRTDRLATPVRPWRYALIPDNEEPAQRTRRHYPRRVLSPTPRTERYAYCLLPNAPPHAA